jgi:YD repeat-containing protein
MNLDESLPRGTRTYAFDLRGRLVALSGPEGCTRLQYDGDRHVVRIVDLEGKVHEIAWKLNKTLVATRRGEDGVPVHTYTFEEPAPEPAPAAESDRPRVMKHEVYDPLGSGHGHVVTYVYEVAERREAGEEK